MACQRLVFGTAGFDLRNSRKSHLELLHAAWNSGITDFDTAPIYAHGQSEVILGEFLKTHHSAKVATKVGLYCKPLPRIPPVVFSTLKLIKRCGDSVRALVTKTMETKENLGLQTRMNLNLNIPLALASLERSRLALGRDCVDRLFFHECSPETANCERTVAFFVNLIASNSIKEAGVCGGHCLDGCTDLARVYQSIQTECRLSALHSNQLYMNRRLILYSALRPLDDLWESLQSSNKRISAERLFDMQLRKKEEVAMLLLRGALSLDRQARIVFFSSKASRINQIASVVESMPLSTEQIVAFRRIAWGYN